MQVRLNKNEEGRLLVGDPWVFANEVKEFIGEIHSGEVCQVIKYDGTFIGQGFLNTSSKIIVRMLCLDNTIIDEAFFENRIKEAIIMRNRCGLDETCRLVFSEADFLPGLIVDKYGDYLSVQFLTLGMDKIKEMIVKLLVKLLHPLGIYERSDAQVRLKEGLEMVKGPLYGSFNPLVQVKENGIKIIVDLENGQKTGYFLDQKLNRKNLSQYAKGKTVLDCFSHTGGFALHAAKYEALKVTAVDISQKACNDITTNALLNGFTNLEVICNDVFDFLHDKEQYDKYDLIILDPPAFTKAKETVSQAYKGYKEINLQAMKIIKKGGILMSFSCSNHMTPTLFRQMLKEASIDAKRRIRLLEMRYQSLDHPMLLVTDESTYLKCAIIYIE